MVNFFVPGVPAPQGSKRAFVVAGKARLVESSKACRPWRDSVRSAALEAIGGAAPWLGPVALRIVFVLPRPATVPKARRGWPATKPDLDKLVRAVLDACTHALFADDSQVVEVTARKWYVGADLGGAVTVGAEITMDEVPCQHNPQTRRGRCPDCGEEATT